MKPMSLLIVCCNTWYFWFVRNERHCEVFAKTRNLDHDVVSVGYRFDGEPEKV